MPHLQIIYIHLCATSSLLHIWGKYWVRKSLISLSSDILFCDSHKKKPEVDAEKGLEEEKGP